VKESTLKIRFILSIPNQKYHASVKKPVFRITLSQTHAPDRSISTPDPPAGEE
jgi:hypothetical protein